MAATKPYHAQILVLAVALAVALLQPVESIRQFVGLRKSGQVLHLDRSNSTVDNTAKVSEHGQVEDPSMTFEEAAEAVKKLPSKLGNDDLLILYGLFKQATVGDVSTQQPPWFQAEARAKWNAWNENKGMQTEEAKLLYVEHAVRLGAKKDNRFGGGSRRVNPMARISGPGLKFPWSPAQMYTTILLATTFQLQRLQEINEGEVLEFILPRPKEPDAVHFNLTLLTKRPVGAGFFTQKQFSIWRNDHPGDKTIYVIFKMMTRFVSQPMHFFWKRSEVSEECAELAIPGLRDIMNEDGIAGDMPKMNCYYASMMNEFWADESLRFGETLQEILLDNPDHRVLFSGYSLGGPQAQIAALRFRMIELRQNRKLQDCGSGCRRRRRDSNCATRRRSNKDLCEHPEGLFVFNQNGLKWTDTAGAKVYQHYFGTRSLELHSTETAPGIGRYYDQAPQFDTRLASLPPTKLLDFDSGTVMDCRPDGAVPCPTSTNNKAQILASLPLSHHPLTYLRKGRCLGWPKLCETEEGDWTSWLPWVAQQQSEGRIHVQQMKEMDNVTETHMSVDAAEQVALAEVGGVSEIRNDAGLDANLADLTGDTLSCITAHCPSDPVSMQPSKRCVVRNCGIKLTKCLFSKPCRHVLKCVNKCSSSLTGDAAYYFTNVTECLSNNCPGFPPSTICSGMHCGLDATLCGLNSGCRHALVCLNQCSQLDVVHNTRLQKEEPESESTWVLEVQKILQAESKSLRFERI